MKRVYYNMFLCHRCIDPDQHLHSHGEHSTETHDHSNDKRSLYRRDDETNVDVAGLGPDSDMCDYGHESMDGVVDDVFGKPESSSSDQKRTYSKETLVAILKKFFDAQKK